MLGGPFSIRQPACTTHQKFFAGRARIENWRLRSRHRRLCRMKGDSSGVQQIVAFHRPPLKRVEDMFCRRPVPAPRGLNVGPGGAAHGFRMALNGSGIRTGVCAVFPSGTAKLRFKAEHRYHAARSLSSKAVSIEWRFEVVVPLGTSRAG